MQRYTDRFTEAPTDGPTETLDVRDLGPPKPLTETLERLPELAAETVLVQRNDRVPQHLFSKLKDRGYTFETVEVDGEFVTAIWRENR